MPATRTLVPLVASAILLTGAGCTGEQRWEQDVTFTVDGFQESKGDEYGMLTVRGELAGEPLDTFSEQGVHDSKLPAGLSVGDTVVCHVVQTADNTLDDSTETEITNCRKT